MSAVDTNNLTITGRLTRPAEIKSTPQNYTLVTFSLAVNKKKKEGDNWVDVAMFFDFTYWGKRAQAIHPYLLKGTQVTVSGALDQDRWQDQEGKNRSKISIVASGVQLHGGQSQNNQNQGSQPPQNPSSNPMPPGNFEDDIPF